MDCLEESEEGVGSDRGWSGGRRLIMVGREGRGWSGSCMGLHFWTIMAPDPEMSLETSCGRPQDDFWVAFGFSRYCFGMSCGMWEPPGFFVLSGALGACILCIWACMDDLGYFNFL